MSVRAKMRVSAIEGNKLTLHCQYDPNMPEDQSFTKATPWGEATFGIDNPAALEQFEVGKAYYLDFTLAE